ncbi:MAG: hypothetical protein KC417_12050, partial [Myxococcales bacterium]|nr:hypothetical protein [Myxococcales bacterium]
MTGWAMAGIAWCLCANAAEAMPSGEDGKRVAEANAAIHDLEIERASAALNGLVERHPEDADVLDAAAMVEFHRGNYPLALTRIRAANRADTSPVTRSHRADLIQLFENTVLATERLVEFQSDDGRYRVKVSAGRDEVLVPYALEALARADEEVSAVLGYRHPGPIRLEVYDSPAVLAQVSTLSEEEIERTGTIALCKWDRLMITSPRALVRGY